MYTSVDLPSIAKMKSLRKKTTPNTTICYVVYFKGLVNHPLLRKMSKIIMRVLTISLEEVA